MRWPLLSGAARASKLPSSWIAQYREGPSDLERHHDLVCWGVLGVARLHYTVATSRITSKTAAGQYALDVFDRRWVPIVSEAIRLRADPTLASDYADLAQRRLAVVAFMSTAIESALRTARSSSGLQQTGCARR